MDSVTDRKLSSKKEGKLANSILDMIDEFKNNPDVLEHIDCITFVLHEIYGDEDIDWYSIGDFCDSVAYAIRHSTDNQGVETKRYINKMLDFSDVRAKAEYLAKYGSDQSAQAKASNEGCVRRCSK